MSQSDSPESSSRSPLRNSQKSPEPRAPSTPANLDAGHEWTVGVAILDLPSASA